MNDTTVVAAHHHSDDDVDEDEDEDFSVMYNSRHNDEMTDPVEADGGDEDVDADSGSEQSTPSRDDSKEIEVESLGSNEKMEALGLRDVSVDASGVHSGSQFKPKGAKRAPTAGQVGVKRPRVQIKPTDTSSRRKGTRSTSVQSLTIPFRTVKKAMKLDPDIPIVQNEAAILTTLAAELFVKSLARQSWANAKLRGRNTIRYEDVAEARTQEPSYSFLETLMP